MQRLLRGKHSRPSLAYTHTYEPPTCLHTHTTHIFPYILIYVCAYTVRNYTHIHIQTHTHTYPCMHAYIQTQTNSLSRQDPAGAPLISVQAFGVHVFMTSSPLWAVLSPIFFSGVHTIKCTNSKEIKWRIFFNSQERTYCHFCTMRGIDYIF